MGLFGRRKETLNEQLLREAGLDPADVLGDAPPRRPEPPKSVLAAVGLPDGTGVGPKEWDATVAVEAPGLAGNRVEFTTIPNGDVIVGEESGDADLAPLADAVERHVDPPYHAVGARQGGDLWAVGAKRIEVAQIPFPDADKLALSQHGADRELQVDGEQSDAAVPAELAALGEAAGDSFYAEAERIDGDLWEVRVTAL
ncbi:MAG TPA: hypothetical protein VGF72_05455 [Gaiellaceae bacterium]